MIEECEEKENDVLEHDVMEDTTTTVQCKEHSSPRNGQIVKDYLRKNHHDHFLNKEITEDIKDQTSDAQ